MLRSICRLPLLVALLGLLSSAARGGVLSPVSVTGWNQDFVWALSEASPGTTITHNGYEYYEQGSAHNSGNGGLPAGPARTFVSAVDLDTTFELAPYDELNSLDMNSSTSGTLTLDAPGRFASLSFLAASGNASGIVIDYVLNFTSGAPTTGSFTVRDWTAPNAITTGLYQPGTGSYPWQGVVGLSEHDVALSAADQNRYLESIALSHGGGGFSWVMGVSGEVIVPEPSSFALTAFSLLGLTFFARRRQNRLISSAGRGGHVPHGVRAAC